MSKHTKNSKITKAARMGGRARAAKLTGAERKASASRAAEARWAKERGIPKATHAGVVIIGDFELDCAVLPDETRVLSQRALARALGASTPKSSDDNLPGFMSAQNLKPFVPNELRATTSRPIWYRRPEGGGRSIRGIPATVIPEICEVWLQAKDADVLVPSQMHIAIQADVLIRALAYTGIIALVDEATGYQYDRARDALSEILEAFISSNLAKWVKTFPNDFYKELFRLRGLNAENIKKRPPYFGHLTNDIVYNRLAPGVRTALEGKNPRLSSGRRRTEHHRWLTRDIGHPALRDHLASVTTMMKLSPDYDTFKGHLDLIHPKYPEVEQADGEEE